MTRPTATPPGVAHAAGGVEGSTSLPSGARASWGYHFDRNALASARGAEGGVVALSAAGHLLRFDPSSLELRGERVGPESVRCLGAGPDGAILAGLDGGRVVRVDPTTLALTPVADLGATPRWVGADARGIVAVVERRAEKGRRGTSFEVVDVASGSHVALNDRPTAFLLDHKRRLWLGADRGEWGGWVKALDLGTKRMIEPKGQISGVYGFFERGGDILAFGGMSHMGLNEGYVARCSEENVTKVAELSGSFGRGDPSRPRGPITHLVDGGAGGELVALSYGSVWRVDTSFSRWTRVRDVELHDRAGRPDAVGSYPAVSAALPDGRGGLLLATVRDGLLRVSESGVERRPVPDQLAVHRVGRIASSTEGVLIFDGPDESVWHRKAGRWAPLPTFPVEPPSSDEGAPSWFEHALHVAPGGTIFTAADTNVTPGRRVVMRWRGGAGEILWSDPKSLLGASHSFMTPDGTLWSAPGGDLLRFDGHSWQRVGATPTMLYRPEVLGPERPPWVLLDHHESSLYRLDPTRGALEPLEATSAGDKLSVLGGVPWQKGSLLLITTQGLRVLPLPGGPAAGPPFAAPEGVRALAHDTLGRLWLGGEGLWVYDPKTGHLEGLDAVPVIGHREVTAIAPDPDRPGGVIASLGAAIVFLDVAANEAPGSASH